MDEGSRPERADLDDFQKSWPFKPWDPSKPKHYLLLERLIKLMSLVTRLRVDPNKALVWLRSSIVFVEGSATTALFSNIDDKVTEWESNYQSPLEDFSHTNAMVDRLYP